MSFAGFQVGVTPDGYVQHTSSGGFLSGVTGFLGRIGGVVERGVETIGQVPDGVISFGEDLRSRIFGSPAVEDFEQRRREFQAEQRTDAGFGMLGNPVVLVVLVALAFFVTQSR